MQDYVKHYSDIVEQFAGSRGESIELLLIGGLAMGVYGIPRHTVDIDAEITCSDDVYYELTDYLRQKGVAFNLSGDISGWGIIPLPSGYRERAHTVSESGLLVLKTLDPVDFVFSKLRRGTGEDFNDAVEVIRTFDIDEQALQERIKLVHFPKDPETLFFKKKYRHLLDLIGKK